LQAENDRLKQAVRELTEKLAVARTESDLFQKQAVEARLRAQTLGVNFDDAEATQAQRQLIASLRALRVAETDRQQAVEQLRRLVWAVEQNRDVTVEVARAKELLAAVNAPPPQLAGGTLGAAAVVDVNPDLQMVVLNVGAAQGARVGMPLVVLRGDRVVAELKVIEVRPRLCGALIEKADKGVMLRVGDHARVAKS
jgi:hypothetical protein